MASLRDLLEPMRDWTQNTSTQAEVKVFVLDTLWQSLPRPPFTDEDTEALAGRVYGLRLAEKRDGWNVVPVHLRELTVPFAPGAIGCIQGSRNWNLVHSRRGGIVRRTLFRAVGVCSVSSTLRRFFCSAPKGRGSYVRLRYGYWQRTVSWFPYFRHHVDRSF